MVVRTRGRDGRKTDKKRRGGKYMDKDINKTEEAKLTDMRI